jgi:hypothetical protein
VATLKESFVKSLVTENPAITPEEIEAEWKLFINEYDSYNAEMAAQYANKGESA